MNSGTIAIVTVCTGNLCRSALMEAGLEARLGSVADVTSAGTHARTGDQSPAAMVAAADVVGLDLRAHRSRPLERSTVEQADLVITASREHRARVATIFPRAARYAFTLAELARIVPLVTDDDIASLAGDDRSTRVRALVPLLGMLRGQAPLAAPGDDDIVDPYGRAASVYATSVDQIMRPLETVGALFDRIG